MFECGLSFKNLSITKKLKHKTHILFEIAILQSIDISVDYNVSHIIYAWS